MASDRSDSDMILYSNGPMPLRIIDLIVSTSSKNEACNFSANRGHDAPMSASD